jgi:MazG family protein
MIVYLIEEVFELAEAIETGRSESIREELGDVLFQVFFIARMFEESGAFGLEDVARDNKEKMIRRHPHVFGDKSASNSAEVRQKWRETKQEEKKSSGTEMDSVLESIPPRMPALMRAYRISERAAGAGFDWESMDEVMVKAEEEWQEFRSEVDGGESRQVSLEFGDILFTLVNVARFARIHPETSLIQATNKFEKRFRLMESKIALSGRKPESVPRDELEKLWEEAKKEVEG